MNTNLVLHSALINEFYLNKTQLDSLESHLQEFCTGTELLHKLSYDGIIEKDSVSYVCVLPSCVKSKFFLSNRLKLSYRVSKQEFKIPPYVLVRFA